MYTIHAYRVYTIDSSTNNNVYCFLIRIDRFMIINENFPHTINSVVSTLYRLYRVYIVYASQLADSALREND